MTLSRNLALVGASQLVAETKSALHRKKTHGSKPYTVVENIRNFCPAGHAPSKRALLSLSPSAWSTALAESPDIQVFNISGLTYEITKALNELSYSVDIVDCGMPGFESQTSYDFYLGHAGHTRGIIDRLPAGAFVLHYASGAYWKVFNRQSHERYDDFCRRKNLPPIRSFVRSMSGAEEGEEYLIRRADAAFLSGPRTIATYGGISRNMSLLYLGSYVQKDLFVDDRDFEAGRTNFVYVAGTNGNIQKGMDLVIETFARLPHLHLYIYCKVEKEVSRAYGRELALANIHYVYHYAWKPLRPRMKALLRRINFTVSAPIDTGPGTAMLGSLGLGLIPVGYVDIEADTSNSVLVDSFSIDALVDCVRRASEKSAEWCRQASRETLDRFQRLHHPPSFGANFKAYLRRIGLVQQPLE